MSRLDCAKFAEPLTPATVITLPQLRQNYLLQCVLNGNGARIDGRESSAHIVHLRLSRAEELKLDHE